ncbi:Protein N-acetyltransferase, RimJ/RimL family [Nocardioides scoriae]|uniref:Protein N-acetyltransferase, RimJ/RimL family n=1 Tax=Nocardioides scoriae TaxID=642780 RepID=A0A1H1UXB4_9ACTN|nr:GNAT family protein [Nocardioides scoriae]SDS77167.1 Protein N-acetyltransferase, RimJ/RimL family [Nocardioides scoriae]
MSPLPGPDQPATGLPAPGLPDVVATSRLRLPLVSPEDAEGMLAGRRRVSWHPDYPSRADQDAAAMVRRTAPEGDACWGMRHLVRAGDGTTVGSIGFFGPPEPADDEVPEVEVRFGLVPDARGHGAATEALSALLAQTDRLGTRVRAGVAPTDARALKVLARCGFTQLRGAGLEGELVMVRPLPA